MKVKRSTLVKNLDTVFSQYIRLRYAKDEIAECVTCGKKDHYKKLQCGHFMSRRHYSTRWDENNVGVQCYGCNITSQGQQFLFYGFNDALSDCHSSEFISFTCYGRQ